MKNSRSLLLNVWCFFCAVAVAVQVSGKRSWKSIALELCCKRWAPLSLPASVSWPPLLPLWGTHSQVSYIQVHSPGVCFQVHSIAYTHPHIPSFTSCLYGIYSLSKIHFLWCTLWHTHVLLSHIHHFTKLLTLWSSFHKGCCHHFLSHIELHHHRYSHTPLTYTWIYRSVTQY